MWDKNSLKLARVSVRPDFIKICWIILKLVSERQEFIENLVNPSCESLCETRLHIEISRIFYRYLGKDDTFCSCTRSPFFCLPRYFFRCLIEPWTIQKIRKNQSSLGAVFRQLFFCPKSEAISYDCFKKNPVPVQKPGALQTGAQVLSPLKLRSKASKQVLWRKKWSCI